MSGSSSGKKIGSGGKPTFWKLCLGELLLQVEEADHVVEAVAVGVREAQLHGLLLVVRDAPDVERLEEAERRGQHAGTVRRRGVAVEVAERVVFEFAVAGDEGERAGGKLTVCLQRQAPRLELGVPVHVLVHLVLVAVAADAVRVVQHVRRGGPGEVVVDHVGDHRDVEGVALVGDGGARPAGLLGAEVAPGVAVLVLAVELPVGERDLGAHAAFGEAAAVEHGAQDLLPVVADGGLDLAPGLLGRAGGDELDGARHVVAAVERALRPAQHLDALDVEHVHQHAVVAREGNAVEGDPGLGVGVGVRVREVDAADGEGPHVGDDGHLRQLDVGRDAAQVLEVHGAVVLEGRAVEGRHRDRDVLDALAALLRGHDDFLEHQWLVGVAVLRGCRRCPQQREGRARKQEPLRKISVHANRSLCWPESTNNFARQRN